MKNRLTIEHPIDVSGICLHSGNASTVKLLPSFSGIRLMDEGVFYPIQSLATQRTARCTRLKFPSGRLIDTIEHLLAAIRIANITDIDIELQGSEFPILDGSSSVWFDRFNSKALVAGEAEYLYVTAPFSFVLGDSVYHAKPGASRLTCVIDFRDAIIGRQSVSLNECDFIQLVRARTFVMEREIEDLKANGIALGGSLKNAIVIAENRVVNPEGFRSPTECAEHKALDFLGDILLAGVPIVGDFSISAPGHSANSAFLEALLGSDALSRSPPSSFYGKIAA